MLTKSSDRIFFLVSMGLVASCSFDAQHQGVCVKDEKQLPVAGILPGAESILVAHLATELCDDFAHTDTVTLFFTKVDGSGRVDAMTYDRASLSTDPVITWRADRSIDVHLNYVHEYSIAPASPALAVHVKVDETD
jgi:hypothetical protein